MACRPNLTQGLFLYSLMAFYRKNLLISALEDRPLINLLITIENSFSALSYFMARHKWYCSLYGTSFSVLGNLFLYKSNGITNSLRRWEYQTILPVSWETCIQIRKQQLESCMEQRIEKGVQLNNGLRKEYNWGVYCHSVYLTYMQNTSFEMLGWMSYKLESRLPGEIPTTSDIQILF